MDGFNLSHRNLPCCFCAFYKMAKISPLAVLDDDVKTCALFVYDAVVVPQNVGMPQLTQNIHFGYDKLLFLITHFPVVQFFPHHYLTITPTLNLMHCSK